MVGTRKEALGGESVSLGRLHQAEAAESSVGDENLLGESGTFNFVSGTDVRAEDLDGVVGTKGLEVSDSSVGAVRFELFKSRFTSGRVPFTLQFVGFETTLLALFHVVGSSSTSIIGRFSKESDVIEVRLGDDATSEADVDVFENVVDDEREDDGTSDSTLASTSSRLDDVSRVGTGVRSSNEEVTVGGVEEREDEAETWNVADVFVESLAARSIEGVLLIDGDNNTVAVLLFGDSFADKGTSGVDDGVSASGSVDAVLVTSEFGGELALDRWMAENESFSEFGDSVAHGDWTELVRLRLRETEEEA